MQLHVVVSYLVGNGRPHSLQKLKAKRNLDAASIFNR